MVIKNVKIRVDASVKIGSGHVMRCLTLAKQLREKGVIVSFISRETQGNLIDMLERHGFVVDKLTKVDMDKENSWYNENYVTDAFETVNHIKNSSSCDLLVVDHYELDAKWESIVKKHVGKIMVIDDLANRVHDCDLLLDQNYLIDYEIRYKSLVSSSTPQLLGPEYVLLRSEFYEVPKAYRCRNGEINNILVFFGGTDPTNETLKTLNALLKLESEIDVINVIVGKSNANKDQIKDLCQRYSNFEYHEQVDNMAEFMNEADLAIGAGGTTTWERCFLGLPSITIVIAENQFEITKAVAEFGATINLGWYQNVEEQDIILEVEKLTKEPGKLAIMNQRSLELIPPGVAHNYTVTSYILEELDGDSG
ncbi:UDP-2,4-diacetamido-2,4,6-trideoxy-beta-L-altropyranose hydrolase [Rossellomorea sp. LjRoot5]|uniref:UDP-2,4-diacetamido-2,4, 6-trideoxy-beta-L-altropyranose hydrolase n=1 Tax=Rossellomorea sp. LjRoot5 TaxID=3342331 RepID=UPI003ECE94AC